MRAAHSQEVRSDQLGQDHMRCRIEGSEAIVRAFYGLVIFTQTKTIFLLIVALNSDDIFTVVYSHHDRLLVT